jgi:2-dehydropantoate 2-reductase
MAISVAIVGPGAIGGVVAARLAQDPEVRLTLCARTPFERLEVTAPDGLISAAPRVITDPAQARPVDWVFVATKAYDVETTALWFPNLVGAHTRVAVLQNGVEHIERFAPYIDRARILPVIVDIPAERSAPGIIRQRRAGSLIVPNTADGDAFAALFANTTLITKTATDFPTALWRKLCVNCAGAVFAITRRPAGLTHDERIADIMRGLMRECITVGRAEGAHVEDDFPESVIAGYRAGPRDAVNSMLADRLAGRPLEIDARNGVIVRLGAKHGIPTPLNALMVERLESGVDEI